MVEVKKREGRIEEYIEQKISQGLKKAGASAEEAEKVVKDVAGKVARRTQLTASELSSMVVTSLRKVNNKAAEEFVKFRDNKLKAKKK